MSCNDAAKKGMREMSKFSGDLIERLYKLKLCSLSEAGRGRRSRRYAIML